MISDEDLKKVMDPTTSFGLSWDQLRELASELLQRRQADRKANSWDDAPDDAVYRRPAKDRFVYYTREIGLAVMESGVLSSPLEERPK